MTLPLSRMTRTGGQVPASALSPRTAHRTSRPDGARTTGTAFGSDTLRSPQRAACPRLRARRSSRFGSIRAASDRLGCSRRRCPSSPPNAHMLMVFLPHPPPAPASRRPTPAKSRRGRCRAAALRGRLQRLPQPRRLRFRRVAFPFGPLRLQAVRLARGFGGGEGGERVVMLGLTSCAQNRASAAPPCSRRSTEMGAGFNMFERSPASRSGEHVVVTLGEHRIRRVALAAPRRLGLRLNRRSNVRHAADRSEQGSVNASHICSLAVPPRASSPLRRELGWMRSRCLRWVPFVLLSPLPRRRHLARGFT
jgi:hypothetical protein